MGVGVPQRGSQLRASPRLGLPQRGSHRGVLIKGVLWVGGPITRVGVPHWGSHHECGGPIMGVGVPH